MTNGHDLRTLLNRYLRPHGEPPVEDVAAGVDRAWRRLQPDTWRAQAPLPAQSSAGRLGGLVAAIAARPLGFALGVAVVLAVSAAMMSGVRPWADRRAVGQAVDGELYRLSGANLERLETGDRVSAGNVLRTAAGEGAQLILTDGSRIEMRAQSALWMKANDDGLRIHLDKGGIIVNAAKQRTGRLFVETRDVTVSVVGTVFLVNADDAGSRVGVIEGEVQVRQGASATTLLPGEHIASAARVPLPPVSEEIAWSRNVVDHLLLLQQSMALQPGGNALAQNTPAPPPAPLADAVRGAVPGWEAVSVKLCPPQAGRGAGGLRSARGANLPQLSPGHMLLPCHTVTRLVASAYVLRANGQQQPLWAVGESGTAIEGGPEWTRSDLYTIDAVAERTPTPAMMQGPMLQKILEDRFRLRTRREVREVPVFQLTVAVAGAKLQPFTPGSCVPIDPASEEVPPPRLPPGQRYCGRFVEPKPPNLELEAEGATLDEFINMFLSGTPYIGRRVIDKTGIAGRFNIRLEFAPPRPEGDPAALADAVGSSIFTALQEQLGLRLQPARGPAEVLVIEGAERPTEN
jgi:uncharacterized protein (TIGR03435 family)